MGQNSNIQWTDATWNVAVGCRKVDADCKFCYMYRDSMQGTRYNPREIRKTKTVFDLPLKLKEPSRIFTSSLTDFFIEEVDEYRNECWDIIRQCPQHTFQILTKRPERIMDNLPSDWDEGYDNVWLGTSIGSENAMHRLYELAAIPARRRFVSFEPLHDRIDCGLDISTLIRIDWIIIGGESGNDTGPYRYRPCKIEWIEELIKDWQGTSAVFVKQLGTHLAKELGLKDRHGGDESEWPQHLRIRQFPST